MKKKENIPPGFNPSPLGLIPIDWEVKELGQLGKFSKGKGILKEQVKEVGFPCIRYGEIYTTHDFIIIEFKSYIDADIAKESKEIKNGDILFAGSGETIEEIGKSVAYVGTEKAFAGGDVIILSTNDNVNVECLSYTLETDIARKQKRTLGQGNSVVHIYSSDLSKLKLPLPPLPEQRTIAACLSTWDEAIQKTNALIAQKEQRKKWLMQMLLTGKKRLKGFKGEWKEEILGNIVELHHGYQFREQDFVKSGIPVIKIRNVIGATLVLTDMTFVNKDRLQEFKDVLIQNGDLLMSLTGNIGRVVEVRGVETPMFQNYRVGKFTPRDSQMIKAFLKFLLSSDILFNQFNGLANQSAQANFGKQDMDKLKFNFPISIEEQTAIANVLQAADKEIELLKQKLEKLKEQKKGLMQVLLTGKKRLKIKK